VPGLGLDGRASLRVGAAVMGLVMAGAAAVMTVDCGELRPGIEVTVYFADLGRLAEGAEVRIAGRSVGRVDSIQLVTARAAAAAAHPLHTEHGGVAVRVRIQKRYASWAAPTSEFLVSAGLLGRARLEVAPPRGGAAWPRALEEGDQIRGVDVARPEQILVMLLTSIDRFRGVVDQVAPAARELRGALVELAATLATIEPAPGAYAELGRSMGALVAELDELAAAWRTGGGDAAHVARIVDAGTRLAGRMRSAVGATGGALDLLLADLARIRGRLRGDRLQQIERAATSARALVARAEATLAVAEELARRVRLGQGTVGALLGDLELTDETKQLGKLLKREPWRVLGHPTREAVERQR
jgi:ABC-type transporter Mla subunit MlaD